MSNNKTFDESAADFMSQTQKATVAVVIPLYGYWNDIPQNPANGEVLNTVLKRIYATQDTHFLYLIFVANTATLPNEMGDPDSIANILAIKVQEGNTKLVPIEREADYPDYVSKGIQYALTETNARFVVVFNPWVLIQEGAIDAIVDRANRADDANVVSGKNVRSLLQPDEGLDQFQSSTPKEEWDINLDFLCMPRFMAEMIKYDPGYQTKPFFQMDMFQQTRQTGFAAVTSVQIPIFPFDFPWNNYETRDMFEADRAYFKSKWGFDCGLIYEEPTL